MPVRTELGLFFLGFRNYFVAPVIKNLIRLMRVVPVDPASELVNAMRASSFIIRHGRSLCIFPEGQRSINGEIKDFKKGIGVLAKELGVKLIPVYIEGAFEAWPRTRRLPRPCPVKIIFGPPAENEKLIGMGYGNGARDDYEAIAIGLRMQILNLRKT